MENRGGKDDEVSGGVWKTIETCIGEVGIGKTEGRRNKERSGEKERGKGEEKETKKEKNSGSKESSRRVEDMG